MFNNTKWTTAIGDEKFITLKITALYRFPHCIFNFLMSLVINISELQNILWHDVLHTKSSCLKNVLVGKNCSTIESLKSAKMLFHYYFEIVVVWNNGRNITNQLSSLLNVIKSTMLKFTIDPRISHMYRLVLYIHIVRWLLEPWFYFQITCTVRNRICIESVVISCGAVEPNRRSVKS